MLNAATHTVSEVITAVKRQFGDESGVQIDDSDIIRWINEAQEVISNKNKVLKAKSTTSSVANQSSYSFPAQNIQQVESIHYDGQRIPNMTFAEAEEYVFKADPTASLKGMPIIWYEWAGTFTFWPAPDDVNDIDVYYTRRPVAVTSASTLDVPDKYYPDIVRYVLQQAYELDEDPQNSQLKQKQFENSLNELSDEERTAANMTYSTIVVLDL
jgi:hypothetical protein